MPKSKEQDTSQVMFSHDVSWYIESPSMELLSPEMAELLTHYGGIPDSGLLDHVKAIRDKAWQTFPFPCVGQFMFLRLRLSSYWFYPKLLEYLNRPGKPLFLDFGACLGQEARKLHFDGIPSSQVFMADRFMDYKSCAGELFRDIPGLGDNYMEFDALTDGAQGLGDLAGQFSVVALINVLHLFDYHTQLLICVRVVKDILKQETGVIIAGSRMLNESKAAAGGLREPNGHSEDRLPLNAEKQIRADKEAFKAMVEIIEPLKKNDDKQTQSDQAFVHNRDTFEQLWEAVGKACGGVNFKVEVRTVPMVNEGLGIWERNTTWLVFWVERV